MRPITVINLLILTLLPMVAFSGGIYRWTDANGQVHFDDQPRSATAEEVIVVPATTDKETVQRLQRQQDVARAFHEKRVQKKQQLAKAREESDKLAANCVKAQTRLMRLQRARYVYVPGSNGERRVLSEPERKKSTDRAKLEVNRWCV